MKKRWRKLYGINTTFVCPYCLRPTPPDEASRDHVLPMSRFHNNNADNIVICCRTCNREKGALTATEYVEWKRLEFIRNGGLSRQK